MGFDETLRQESCRPQVPHSPHSGGSPYILHLAHWSPSFNSGLWWAPDPPPCLLLLNITVPGLAPGTPESMCGAQANPANFQAERFGFKTEPYPCHTLPATPAPVTQAPG